MGRLGERREREPPDDQTTRPPDHQATRPADHQDHQASKPPDHQATRPPEHQSTRTPEHQATRPPGHQTTTETARPADHHGDHQAARPDQTTKPPGEPAAAVVTVLEPAVHLEAAQIGCDCRDDLGAPLNPSTQPAGPLKAAATVATTFEPAVCLEAAQVSCDCRGDFGGWRLAVCRFSLWLAGWPLKVLSRDVPRKCFLILNCQQKIYIGYSNLGINYC